MAHQLCYTCQNLSFKLHLRGDCKSLNCKVSDDTFIDLHSELVLHSSNMDELDAAAARGCHLCSLLSVGLHSASRIPTNLSLWKSHRVSRESVHIFFTCSTSNIWEIFEEIIAICGDIVTSFPVARVPQTHCSEPGFFTLRNRPGPLDLRYVRFRALYLGQPNVNAQLHPGSVCGPTSVQNRRKLTSKLVLRYLRHAR
jgi:hypothetical protein